MTDQALASYSNLALYSTMAVLTLAMLAFAVDLAALGSRVQRSAAGRDRGGDRELVTAGSAPATTGDPEGARDANGPGSAGSGAPDGSADRRQWAGIGMSLSWLGAALLVACVALRGLSVHRAPLGNMYEFAIVAAAFVMVAFLGWSLRRDLRWLGLFVVGPVLLILGLALAVYTEASQLMPSLQSIWLVIHVTVATLSVALFSIAFSITLLYLVKHHREVRPPARSGFMEALPKAAALERTAYGLHVVAFPLWTFTLIAGSIWAEQAWGTYWGWDPKEVWTFVIWVVYAAYLHARATSGWTERKAAWLAVAGFVCIIINYTVVNMFIVGMHSYSGL